MDYSTGNYQYQPQYQYQFQYPRTQTQQGEVATAYDPSPAQVYYDYGHNYQQYQNYPLSGSYNYQEPNPPGVSIAQDLTSMNNQQNAYYSNQSNLRLGEVNQVAASQSQGVVQPQSGQSSRKGADKKGGRSFRGGGRGRSGYHGRRPDGSALPFRGRGRDQVGGRHLPLQGVASIPNYAFPPAEGMASLMPPSASVQGHAPEHVPNQVPTASAWPPPHMAWCELCRVDCNTLEVLEQHKNGKRHKKNLQNLNKVKTEQQNMQIPDSGLKQEGNQPEVVVGSKEKDSSQDGSSFRAVTEDNGNESDRIKVAQENSKAIVTDSAQEPESKSRDCIEARGHGFKRKMRGGRVGKYVRANDGTKKPAEASNTKQFIPFLCELCNVKCESQVVFDSHLAGKKHLSKLKRFHGHQALYGKDGVQALYPPNFNATPSSLITQIQQGVNDPQLILAQLLTYVLNQVQAPGLVDTQVTGLAAIPAESAGPVLAPGALPSLETQYHAFVAQGSGAIIEAGSHNDATVEARSQQESMTSKFETPTGGNKDIAEENKTSASEVRDINLLHGDAKDISLPENESKDVLLPQKAD